PRATRALPSCWAIPRSRRQPPCWASRMRWSPAAAASRAARCCSGACGGGFETRRAARGAPQPPRLLALLRWLRSVAERRVSKPPPLWLDEPPEQFHEQALGDRRGQRLDERDERCLR